MTMLIVTPGSAQRVRSRIRQGALAGACAAILAACGPAADPPEPDPAPRVVPLALHNSDGTVLRNLRAVHMEGNFGNNTRGIRSALPSPLVTGPEMTAASVTVAVGRGSFVDASGATITDDVARVDLTDVRIGDATRLNRAGFWIVRNVQTGATLLQFRPSLDPSLAGVAGFPRDLNLSLSADGSVAYWDDALLATGAAAQFVAAVLTHGADLIARASTYNLNAPAALDSVAATAILRGLHDRILESSHRYFDFLQAQHVQWLGISVAMFVDSVGDPTVRLRYKPPGSTSNDIYTFDDADLRDFIARARDEGLRVYLTLAFEPSGLNLSPSPSDPTCGTASFVPNRIWFGDPQPGDPSRNCIAAAQWWWNPAHPEHGAKVAAFWSSYQSVAVKMAKLAQDSGVEIFSPGTETERLFRTRPSAVWPEHFRPQLEALVRGVRAVFSGVLTYDQHYSVMTSPEYYAGGVEGNVHLFADLQLDAVGISAYFPLAPAGTRRLMALDELDAAWTRVFENYLVPLQRTNPGKPILFTEIGYTDDLGAVALAGSGEGGAITGADAQGITDGMRQQDRIIQAFFNVNERYGQLVGGTFWWGNQILLTPDDWFCHTVYFNQYCNPSAATVARQYAVLERRDTDRLFDWAESHYAEFFPSHATTATGYGYDYRYYPATGNYLGTRAGRVVVHNGRDWNFLDVGSVASFLDVAGLQGY